MNPMGFFRRPTPEEIAAHVEKTRAENLRKYGNADRVNEKMEAGYKALEEARRFPADSPEKIAKVQEFLRAGREAHRLDNLENLKTIPQRQEAREIKRQLARRRGR